jgi:membrane protein DedA with SNARE-associated domain
VELLQALTQQVAGLPLPLAMLAIALATFVSEDLACIAAALIAARGEMPLFAALSAAGLGIWIGDMGLYALGALLGRARYPARNRIARGRLVYRCSTSRDGPTRHPDRNGIAGRGIIYR